MWKRKERRAWGSPSQNRWKKGRIVLMYNKKETSYREKGDVFSVSKGIESPEKSQGGGD